MNFLDWLRVIVLGIIEGVTEWLPVSSTGHLILLDEIWKGNPEVFTEEFTKIFDVIIQLGAILAVVTLFFHKLNPISSFKTDEQKKNTWSLWGKVVAAIIPTVVVGPFLDDWMDAHLYRWYVVAAMLIVYGIAFIILETKFKDRDSHIVRFSHLNYKTALLIGVFQLLALVPGTSRSGVTILGAMILGCSRYIATEFTFFLAIPAMFGACVLKLFKYVFIKHLAVSNLQLLVLLVSMVVAYLVSIVIIKFMVAYVKRHDFKSFGVYRIVLGILVILLFAFVLK